MTYGPQRIAGAVIALAALAGCGGSPAPAKGAPAAVAPASASTAAGCAQATAAVRAARGRLNAQDYAGAVTRISDLRDTLPRGNGKLAIDAAFAATDLAFLNYDVASGNPVYQALKDVYAALDKIDADCANGSA